MASPRTFNIYLRPGKGMTLDWSFFNSQEDDLWNPLTETSPNLLLKRNDEVNWIATDGIDSLDIIPPASPKVFGSVSGNNTKNPKSQIPNTMQGGGQDKYTIIAKVGSTTITVDPKNTGDQPPD